MNTSDLERILRARADLAGPPPADLVSRVREVRRTRRRRRTALLATAAAALVLAVAVPAIISLTGNGSRSATASPASAPIYGQQTRGPLAGDTDLVAAVRDLSWPAAAPDDRGGINVNPPLGFRHVDFLGDVEGTRYALVTGTVAGDLYAAWFTAPAGSDAAGFVLAGSPKLITGDEPAAFADTTVASPVALVVAAPGDTVEFSDRAVLTAEGRIVRTYTAGQQVDDGVAALPATPAGVGGVSVRVSRDNITAWRAAPDIDGNMSLIAAGDGSAGPTPLDDVSAQVADPRATAGAVTSEQLAMAFTDITTALQLPLDELQATLLWAGPIPGPDNRTSTAVVVGATAPSGGSLSYAMTFVNDPTGGYSSSPSGWETYDNSRPLIDRAQLLRTAVSDGTASGPTITSTLLIDPIAAPVSLRPSADGGSADLAPGVHLLDDNKVASAALLDVNTGTEVARAELMPSGYFDRYDYGNGPA